MDVEGRDHFPLCEYLKLHAEQGLEAYPYQIPAKQADQHPKNAEVEWVEKGRVVAISLSPLPCFCLFVSVSDQRNTGQSR